MWKVTVVHYNGSSADRTEITDSQELFISQSDGGGVVVEKEGGVVAFFGQAFSAIKEQVND